ncbi:hypothetical protein QL285_009604 [Trifolium repens]|nr:hypothetical protein QL285_009604 [Trifolium repens]
MSTIVEECALKCTDQRFRNQNTTKHNFEGREKDRDRDFILVPLTNREYVQSSWTSKRVHYNHKRLQMLKHTCKRLPMLKYTNKRLPNAQARRQETSKHKYKKNRV